MTFKTSKTKRTTKTRTLLGKKQNGGLSLTKRTTKTRKRKTY